jgi:hypothetical protein
MTATGTRNEPSAIVVAQGGANNSQERFDSKAGNMTLRLQSAYLQRLVAAETLPATSLDDEMITCLWAMAAPEALYWWQIFNLTGREPLFALSKAFYDRVFTDDDETFRGSFARGSDAKGHATFFSLVLIDAFGGGGMYPGGGK